MPGCACRFQRRPREHDRLCVITAGDGGILRLLEQNGATQIIGATGDDGLVFVRKARSLASPALTVRQNHRHEQGDRRRQRPLCVNHVLEGT